MALLEQEIKRVYREKKMYYKPENGCTWFQGP